MLKKQLVMCALTKKTSNSQSPNLTEWKQFSFSPSEKLVSATENDPEKPEEIIRKHWIKLKVKQPCKIKTVSKLGEDYLGHFEALRSLVPNLPGARISFITACKEIHSGSSSITDYFFKPEQKKGMGTIKQRDVLIKLLSQGAEGDLTVPMSKIMELLPPKPRFLHILVRASLEPTNGLISLQQKQTKELYGLFCDTRDELFGILLTRITTRIAKNPFAQLISGFDGCLIEAFSLTEEILVRKKGDIQNFLMQLIRQINIQAGQESSSLNVRMWLSPRKLLGTLHSHIANDKSLDAAVVATAAEYKVSTDLLLHLLNENVHLDERRDESSQILSMGQGTVGNELIHTDNYLSVEVNDIYDEPEDYCFDYLNHLRISSDEDRVRLALRASPLLENFPVQETQPIIANSEENSSDAYFWIQKLVPALGLLHRATLECVFGLFGSEIMDYKQTAECLHIRGLTRTSKPVSRQRVNQITKRAVEKLTYLLRQEGFSDAVNAKKPRTI